MYQCAHISRRMVSMCSHISRRMASMCSHISMHGINVLTHLDAWYPRALVYRVHYISSHIDTTHSNTPHTQMRLISINGSCEHLDVSHWMHRIECIALNGTGTGYLASSYAILLDTWHRVMRFSWILGIELCDSLGYLASDYVGTWTPCNMTGATYANTLGRSALDGVSHLDTKQYWSSQYIPSHLDMWAHGDLAMGYVGTWRLSNGICEHHGDLAMGYVSIMAT
jgi:hypothetical protein